MFKIFNKVHNKSASLVDEQDEFALNILESISDGFAFLDKDWNVLFWNKAAEQMLKRDKEQIINKNIWSVFPDAKELVFFSKIEESIKLKESVEFEGYYPAADLWVSITTFPFENGTAIYFKDISAKKELSIQLEYIRDQQEEIINATSDMIWSVDTNYKLLLGNKSYLDVVFDRTGVRLKPGDDVLAPLPAKIIGVMKRNYDRALAGEEFCLDNDIADDEGNITTLEIKFKPILKANTKQVIGTACYCRDITERRRYQNEIEEKNRGLKVREKFLNDSTERLESVLNSSLDLICSIDKLGRYVHVNEASIQMLGYLPAEMEGIHISDIIHPDDIAETLEVSSQVVNGGRVTAFRNRLIKKRGDIKHLMWSARWDVEKELMFCVGRDASTLVQAEIVKAETERKFTALIQRGADMIGILEPDGVYSYVSPNVYQVLGYHDYELINRNAFELVHPEDLAFVTEKWEMLSATNEITRTELRFKDKEGDWRWIELLGTNLLDDPAIKGIVINSRDITKRKQRENELVTANLRYQTVMNMTNDVIWELDLATGKYNTNKKHGEVYGHDLNREDIELDCWLSNIHTDDVQRVKNSIMAFIASNSNEQWKEYYRYTKANGEHAYIVDRGTLIKDKQGKSVRMIGAMEDITDWKKHEAEREQIIMELTRSNADLKQFSFITSHNLRAPLSNIAGLLSIVDKQSLEQYNHNLVEMLSTSTQQLQETIDDLCDIITIRNNQNPALSAIELPCLFDKAVKTFLNPLNDIAFNVTSNFKVKQVTFNRAYLESIFVNLLSNSVKYRDQSRTLQISAASMHNDQDNVVIVFTDNGIGFDSQRLGDRVFGLYQRFHEGFNGKGIGLFTVKSQIVALGGSVKVDSVPGKGTSVIITLPG